MNNHPIESVALTQVMTRMIMPTQSNGMVQIPARKIRLKTVILLSAAYLVLNCLLIGTVMGAMNAAAQMFAILIFSLGNIPVVIAFCITVRKTRARLRNVYDIPERWHFEDYLVSLFCLPCGLSQMMQQTADYDTYRAIWFSETGLPSVNIQEPNWVN
jgi:Cys-rich protein (TIGR01571 family)